MTFELFEKQESGAPLWRETQRVRVDDHGRYLVYLGAVTPMPRLPSPKSAIVYIHTFNCGLYLVRGLEEPEPEAPFIYAFEERTAAFRFAPITSGCRGFPTRTPLGS